MRDYRRPINNTLCSATTTQWSNLFRILAKIPPELLDMCIKKTHDGAPFHVNVLVREYLIKNNPDRWIGRGDPTA